MASTASSGLATCRKPSATASRPMCGRPWPDPDLDSKLSAVGQVFNPGTSAEFTQAMDDQLKTVKRIGDTLGIKPASAEVSGAQPGETIGAKTAQ
jgi:hypothetical protein